MAAEGARTLPASSPATSRDSVEAPWWHLPLLVSFVVVVSATGLLLGPGATPQSPRFRILSAYVPMLLVAWGFVGYVALASPSESLVSRWVGNRDRGRLAADVALGFASMA
ncbi:MAG TPA: hypothetical protein VHE30_26915, partial [Polyangiaceae bacterium]|nr:hypothetical protein [Polyangiaceae bacterium]